MTAKEKRRIYSRRYYEKNRAKCYAASRQWVEQNQERMRELRRDSARRNPIANRRRRHERRARERNARVERVEPDVVYAQHNGCCGICGEVVDPKDFHVDHIIPLAKGGDHSYDNTQPAHPSCNLKKHARLP